jgi:hypothetical protein
MRREDARERKGVRLEGSAPDEGGRRKEGGKKGMRRGWGSSASFRIRLA